MKCFGARGGAALDLGEAVRNGASHKLTMRLATAKKNGEIFKTLLQILLCAMIICSVSCTNNTVNIQSYILRNRVVVLDRVLMKKALYVSFSFTKSIKKYEPVNVRGFLLNGDKVVCETSLKAFSGNSGNLVFDLPYQIPEGQYKIKIDTFIENGKVVATGFIVVDKSDFKWIFDPKSKNTSYVFEEIPAPREAEVVKPTKQDRSVGYLLFSRLPFEYVFPES